MSTLHTQPRIGGFSNLLKVMRQQIFFISAGREFHSRGQATEKILSPYQLRDGGMSLFVVECNNRSALYIYTTLYNTIIYVYNFNKLNQPTNLITPVTFTIHHTAAVHNILPRMKL